MGEKCSLIIYFLNSTVDINRFLTNGFNGMLAVSPSTNSLDLSIYICNALYVPLLSPNHLRMCIEIKQKEVVGFFAVISNHFQVISVKSGSSCWGRMSSIL